jgi:hypothetical protein
MMQHREGDMWEGGKMASIVDIQFVDGSVILVLPSCNLQQISVSSCLVPDFYLATLSVLAGSDSCRVS